MPWLEAAISPAYGSILDTESDYDYWKKHRAGKGKPSLRTFLYRRINIGLSLEESVYPGNLKEKEKK